MSCDLKVDDLEFAPPRTRPSPLTWRWTPKSGTPSRCLPPPPRRWPSSGRNMKHPWTLSRRNWTWRRSSAWIVPVCRRPCLRAAPLPRVFAAAPEATKKKYLLYNPNSSVAPACGHRRADIDTHIHSVPHTIHEPPPSIAAHFAAFFCAAPRRCGGFWRPLVAVFRCGWCAAACNCGVELWACGRQRPPRRWLPPSFSRSLPVPRCRRQPRRRSSQHSTHAHSSLFPTLYIRCVLP